MVPKPRTARTPHNKSERARAAEVRGERTWTGWRLADLIEQVVALNSRDVSAKDLRAVKNLEYLKVKLLVPTEAHHTGLRMSSPVTLKQDQFFGVAARRAERLRASEVARWRDDPPTDEELDRAVENLTGRKYYREKRKQ